MQGSVRRGVARRLRRVVTWRPRSVGTEPVDIAALIAPLRLDVLVRARFLDWLEPRLDADLETVAAEAGHQPYAVWFRRVEVARFRRHLASDPAALEAAFADRVRRTAALLRSYREHGFDRAHPVTLRVTGVRPLSDSGLTVAKTLHVGDGGHRLALLLRDGRPLEPGMYVRDPRPMPVIDNTSLLVGPLGIPADEYAAFLGPWFGEPAVTSLAALESAVAAESASRAAELRAVIRTHLAAGVRA
ncbi:MAG: hypothetical protein ACRCY8_01255 [Dermatophilaceae bacterium]